MKLEIGDIFISKTGMMWRKMSKTRCQCVDNKSRPRDSKGRYIKMKTRYAESYKYSSCAKEI